MTVTEIKPGKHNTQYVFIDGEFSFSAYDEVLYKYSIKQGEDISAEALEEAKKIQNGLYAKNRALDILSRAALSRNSLYKKLLEKGISEEDADKACNFCEEQGFINDEELLNSVIMRLYTEKKYGRQRIITYLLQKGFEKDAVLKVLNELDFDCTDEIVSLIKASDTDFDDKKQISKLYQKLLRKGFSYSEIKEGIGRFTDMEIDDGE